MCRFGCRPEARYREAAVEVGSKVIHDGDGEHDVHAKLSGRVSEYVVMRRRGMESTLKTSRLGPPMIAVTGLMMKWCFLLVDET